MKAKQEGEQTQLEWKEAARSDSDSTQELYVILTSSN